VKLFFDEHISFRIPRALHQLIGGHGHEAVALRDKFSDGISDIEWITKLGQEGNWAIITDDHRIRKNPAERRAWRETDLIGFFFAPGWRKLDVPQQAAKLILWLPKLEAQIGLVGGGAIFELPVRAGSRLKSLPI